MAIKVIKKQSDKKVRTAQRNESGIRFAQEGQTLSSAGRQGDITLADFRLTGKKATRFKRAPLF